MGQKKAKGSVSIVNDTGRIRLRWRYQQKRYSLNLFQYTKSNLQEARKIALTIEHDIVQSVFDATLRKYKPEFLQELPVSKKLHEHFETWVRDYRNRDVERDVDYYLTRQMLKRWGTIHISNALALLGKEKIAPKTYNTRLRLLRAFFTWGIKSKLFEENPFDEVSPRKLQKKKVESRKPFTVDEISRILDAIKKDTYCPSNTIYRHSHYYPFLYFIFQMGVRPAEAVGLRVGCVDFKDQLVTIKESLARTKEGTHAKARKRKETKNGKVRMLPLDAMAIDVLKPLVEGRGAGDLVFLSPTGVAIDDRMFHRRVFKMVLVKLEIEYRTLYACRHTFGSRCIHEGLTPVMTAFLMGNNPETALRNYVHLVELPKALPTLINTNTQDETEARDRE